MAFTVKVNGTALPGEIIECRVGRELLWSEGTGRSADNGTLVGSVVSRKQTWTVTWGVITQAEYNAICAIPEGFFNLLITDGNTTLADITAYRSDIQAYLLGTFPNTRLNPLSGTRYWKNAEVQFTEQ